MASKKNIKENKKSSFEGGTDSKSKPKVMIVDDDRFLLDMYTKKFDNNGYDSIAAVGPEDCLDQLENGADPDVLLFDLIMPKMDGITLFKTIQEKKLAVHAKKIILSNQGQSSDLDKVKGLGIDGYIIKALNTPSQVVDRVTEIFNKK